MTFFGDWIGNILPVGTEILFLGQPRVSGILTNFDTNEDGQVALDVRYVGKKRNEMTGYWFDVNDFSPPLDTIDLRSYGGLIICWKNINGRATFMPPELKLKNEQISKLNKLLQIYKKYNLEALSILEGKKISEERKKETIEVGKQLKALKDIVSEKDIIYKKDSKNLGATMFTR